MMIAIKPKSLKRRSANDNRRLSSAKNAEPSLLASALLGFGFALMLFGLWEALELFADLFLNF